mgnify:CR=1 FL=1
MATYEGGCHCQAVRFTVQLEDPKQELYRCNCSLCRKKGIVMRAVADTDLEVIAGQEHLSLYQWNKKIAEHFFCSVCAFIPTTDVVAIPVSFRSISNVWMELKCPRPQSWGW